MLTFLLGVSSFLFFTSIGFLIVLQILKNRIMIYKRVSPFLTSHSVQHHSEQKEEDIRNKSLYIRFIKPIFVRGRLLVIGWMPKQKMARIEKKLQAAGYPFGMSAGDFVSLQVLLPAIFFLLIILLFAPVSKDKIQVFLFAFIAAFFAYAYTNYYLTAKSKQRIQLLEKSMPDFFDLLNVSIEAGMGLDSALRQVCKQMDDPLSKEFFSALEDMKLGKSRKQAFLDLKERVPSDFFKGVMSSIIQADQMGLGMSKVLRTQTGRIREKQRFTVREQAMKAPVKMLIPMVIFIFPTLFVVLLGPVVINLMNQFM